MIVAVAQYLKMILNILNIITTAFVDLRRLEEKPMMHKSVWAYFQS